MTRICALFVVFMCCLSCQQKNKNTQSEPETLSDSTAQIAKRTAPFVWEGANIYFLLTDRFNNGNLKNDISFERKDSTAILRGFMGGDIQGITQKIEANYFSDLGVNAIWFTPVVEQIHGPTDEGTGNTYGYHGYWTKDWTALDPNLMGARRSNLPIYDV